MGRVNEVLDRRRQKRLDKLNKLAFQEARASAASGQMVCGTFKPDGEPVYFHMPANASEEAIAEVAFRMREGRPRAPGEKILAELALKRKSA